MGIKKTVLAVVAMLVMMTATCFAQITFDDLKIGGVYVGQPMEEVLEKYGEPVEITVFAPKGDLYHFKDENGSEIKVARLSPSANYVISISLTGSSRIFTSAGIGLGSKVDDIISVYGTPDSDYLLFGNRCLDYHFPIESKIYRSILLQFVTDKDNDSIKAIGSHYVSKSDI